MAKSFSPNDLTQVAIQPSASPISLNVLPAPGQRLAGNTLQQIGESLAAFSPSLQGMLAQRVEADKRALASQGAAVDFSRAFDVPMDASPEDRQQALNQAFKDAISKQGGPDSANPFFLIAARQNFGRAVGLRYRNALASLKDKATDPNNPVPFGELAQQAAEMAGASEVTNDVYGASGFSSVAQEVNSEMSIAFQQELLKRKDFLAIENTQKGISDGLLSAAASVDGFTPDSTVGKVIQQSIDSIQLTTSDPETARRTVVGAAQVALSQVKDEGDAEEIMSAMSGMRFGTASIRENPALYVQLLRLKEQRIGEITAEESRKERVFGQQVQRHMKGIYALGFNEKASDAILNGNLEGAQQVLGKTWDEYLTKNPNIDPAVRDTVRRQMQIDLDSIYSASLRQRNAANDAAFERGFSRIDDGAITTMSQLREYSEFNGLTVTQQGQMRKYFDENVGVVKSSADSYALAKSKEIISRIIQSKASSGLLPTGANGNPVVTPTAQDEAQAMEMDLRAGALEQVQQFVRGMSKDPTGKTYGQIKEESGTDAANRSIIGVLDSWYDARIKEYNTKNEATKAAVDAGMSVSSVTKESSFVEDVASVQKNASNAAAMRLESENLTVDERNAAVLSAMEQEIAETQKIGYEVGFGFGGQYNPDVLVARLGRMWDVAQRSGTIGVRKLGWVMDSSVQYTPDVVLRNYGRVKRSASVGLTPDEVISNVTSDGVPVFGVVLPHRKDAVNYAFSVPMFRSESEIRDPAKVNAVLDALSLPNTVREQFVARQATLIKVREAMRTKFDSLTRESRIGGEGMSIKWSAPKQENP